MDFGVDPPPPLEKVHTLIFFFFVKASLTFCKVCLSNLAKIGKT